MDENPPRYPTRFSQLNKLETEEEGRRGGGGCGQLTRWRAVFSWRSRKPVPNPRCGRGRARPRGCWPVSNRGRRWIACAYVPDLQDKRRKEKKEEINWLLSSSSVHHNTIKLQMKSQRAHTHTHTSPKTRTDNIDPFLSAHAFRLSTNSQTDVCELFSHFQLSFNYRNGDLDHHLVPSNEERKARKVIEYRIEVSDWRGVKSGHTGLQVAMTTAVVRDFWVGRCRRALFR